MAKRAARTQGFVSGSRMPVAGVKTAPLLGIAGAALLLGVVVYLLDRATGSAYFLPAALSLADNRTSWFGALGGQLPDFLHAYALSLLTAAALGTNRRAALVSCTLWWAIDSLFELGQHPAVGHQLAAAVPQWFEGIPFLENTGAYFAHGTFDPADLIAIALGALAAWATLAGLHSGKEGHHVRTQQP